MTTTPRRTPVREALAAQSTLVVHVQDGLGADEVKAVINKKSALRQQLQGHLNDGHSISKWIWVASGRNGFPKDSQYLRRLSQHGITFVGEGCVMAKHLP